MSSKILTPVIDYGDATIIRDEDRENPIAVRFEHVSFAYGGGGNALSDGFSDTPVLVAAPSVLKALLGTDLDSLFLIKKDFETESSERIRLIPFSTVGDNGVLKAVLIDKVRVPKSELMIRHVLLAQSKEKNLSDEYSVLLSNNFLERGTYEHDSRKTSKLTTKN